MGNMSKKTWKLRVWNHMTEMQKLDILLKHAKVPHTYGRLLCRFLYVRGRWYLLIFRKKTASLIASLMVGRIAWSPS